MIDFILIAALSYLIGAIPFGYLVGKMQGIDVRRYGSGKTGATNTLRTLGTRSSIVVFAADLAKGVVVVLLARYLLHSAAAEVVAALSAMVGHNWSVYIRFFGGRGVTISVGSMMTIFPPATFLGIFVFAAVTGFTRYVSLGSIASVSAIPPAMAIFVWAGFTQVEYLVYALVGAPIVVFAHRDNILRLRAGRERKLGEKAEIRGT